MQIYDILIKPLDQIGWLTIYSLKLVYPKFHCSQERITNPQKHCRVKPKWFLDLWTYFEHAHIDEFW